MKDPQVAKLFTELTYAFNADTKFRATTLIMPEMLSFIVNEDIDDGRCVISVQIDGYDTYDQVMDKYVSAVDMLEFEFPEDFDLAQPDYADSMAAYYKKHGTKGEF